MLSEINEFVEQIFLKLTDNHINKFREWSKIVQLKIDDDYYFIDFSKLSKDNVLTEGEIDQADFTIIAPLDIFKQLLTGEIEPVEAVVQGLVAIDGSLVAAVEFSELLSEVKSDIS